MAIESSIEARPRMAMSPDATALYVSILPLKKSFAVFMSLIYIAHMGFAVYPFFTMIPGAPKSRVMDGPPGSTLSIIGPAPI